MLDIPPLYQPDVLGAGFEQCTLHFPPDYEGEVVATLVRKKTQQSSQKAVLYIHGFMDYFFQTEMAEQFNKHGFHFYALDLRKYGRSHRAHQCWYNVRDLSEYDAEIHAALNMMQSEGNEKILLAGHSTGGLITTLFIHHYSERYPSIQGLWANSPFYNFNMPKLKRRYALPQLNKLAKLLPDLRFPSELNRWYAHSLHQQLGGEWDFNLEWKKKSMPLVRLSFVRAIFQAQQPIYRGLRMPLPALIMHSHQTLNPKKWGTDAQNSDIILDVADIQIESRKMQGDVTLCAIENGLHDLVLSKKPVREQVYDQLFEWLNSKGF